MPDASPTKWHLAHTTWFFETFLLKDHLRGYRPFDAAFGYLFNSYYEAVGPRHARPQRGLLTRPPLARVLEYRRHVDAAMARLADRAAADGAVAPLIVLGLHHEQQHQELLLMDIKHAFACNPLHPAYAPVAAAALCKTAPLRWVDVAGGIREIGDDGDGFAFDNEGPRHEVLIRDVRNALDTVVRVVRSSISDSSSSTPRLSRLFSSTSTYARVRRRARRTATPAHAIASPMSTVVCRGCGIHNSCCVMLAPTMSPVRSTPTSMMVFTARLSCRGIGVKKSS